MEIGLLCAGMLIHGNARAIEISGRNFNVVEQHMRLAAVRPRVYVDGQYQIIIARNRNRVWVQLDRDDNPHDRGEMIHCKRKP